MTGRAAMLRKNLSSLVVTFVVASTALALVPGAHIGEEAAGQAIPKIVGMWQREGFEEIIEIGDFGGKFRIRTLYIPGAPASRTWGPREYLYNGDMFVAGDNARIAFKLMSPDLLIFYFPEGSEKYRRLK